MQDEYPVRDLLADMEPERSDSTEHDNYYDYSESDYPLRRLPRYAPNRESRTLSGRRIDADREKVARYCANQIRLESRRAVRDVYSRYPSGYSHESRPPIDDEEPLTDRELYEAAVAMCLSMVEVMERPQYAAPFRELDLERDIAVDEEPLTASEHFAGVGLPDEALYVAEDEYAALAGLMLFRATHSMRIRSRSYKHEMAHHLQRTRVAIAVYRTQTVLCHERNGGQVRESICKMVESLL